MHLITRTISSPVFRAVQRVTRLMYLIALLPQATETYRQRRRLVELPDRLLADIGISREEARSEATRSFWDLA